LARHIDDRRKVIKNYKLRFRLTDSWDVRVWKKERQVFANKYHEAKLVRKICVWYKQAILLRAGEGGNELKWADHEGRFSRS